MTSTTNVLLLSALTLSTTIAATAEQGVAAEGAEAGGVTIHGASWGRVENAPPPAEATAATLGPTSSGAVYRKPAVSYGQNLRGRTNITYAGSFALDFSKRELRRYEQGHNIIYGQRLERTRTFDRRENRPYAPNRQRYGNRIRYGHGRGYSIRK
jgi:hypothetical protein